MVFKQLKIMRIIILILSMTVFIILNVKAQGNLQFNQVINLEYSSNTNWSARITVGSVTVPAGKVWKITSGSLSKDNGTNYDFGNATLMLYFDNIMILGNYNTSDTPKFPIWLSPGTYSVIFNVINSSYFYYATVSAIEFNVVP